MISQSSSCWKEGVVHPWALLSLKFSNLVAGLIGKAFIYLFFFVGVGWMEEKEKNFVKILSCSCKTKTLKGIIYKIFRSLPLKGNCLFISFCKQEAHFLSHPMPKVAISKQHEVNGREQF